MKMVKFECRDCGSAPEFATEKHTDDLEVMQEHMDINFKARCGGCYSCNWEVVGIFNGRPKRFGTEASHSAVQ